MINTKPILFLDIDGVVNTLMIYNEPMEECDRGKISRDGYYFVLCYPSDKKVSNKQAVLWLSKTCEYIGCDIVISSSWRMGHTTEEIADCLYNSGLSRNIKVIGQTPVIWDAGSQRGDEIQKWIDDNKFRGRFFIVDDDTDMAHLKNKLIKCDVNTGFNYQQYYDIITLFEKESDFCE